MLSDPDKNYVIEVLAEVVGPLENPRQTLAAPFLGTTFPQDLGQGLPGELVRQAVHLCLIDAWNHDPPWIVLLLDLFNLGAVDERIGEIRARVRHKPPPSSSPDPLESTILSTGSPFVNRASLRSHLRRLATPAANIKPILVVNGSTKSGKSYSTNYIDHFSYNKPPIITYRMEFDPDLGMELGAEQVASELVFQMGRPLSAMPKPLTNQKLYAQQLALWVLNEAAQSQSQHWFILDNFRGEKLRQDTRELLIALSNRITTGVFPQRCRLILIGFDRALLTVDAGKVEEETLNQPSAGEVRVCVEEIVKLAPVQIAAAQVSPNILTGLPNGDGRLAELNLRLRALIYAVTEVRRILQPIPGADYLEILLKMLEGLPDGEDRMKTLQERLKNMSESAEELEPDV